MNEKHTTKEEQARKIFEAARMSTGYFAKSTGIVNGYVFATFEDYWNKEQPQHTTTEKSEGFYCKEQGNVGYTCEEQCPACNKAENMPDIPRETSEEERIREKLWDWYSRQVPEDSYNPEEEYAELVAGKQIMFKDDFDKAIQSIYTEIIEPLKKRIAKLISIFVQQRSRIKELMDEQKAYETRIKVLLEQIKVRDEEIEPLKKDLDWLNGVASTRVQDIYQRDQRIQELECQKKALQQVVSERDQEITLLKTSIK